MTISKLYLLRKIDESNEFNLLPLSNGEKVSNPNSFLYSLLPAPLPLVQSLISIKSLVKLQLTSQGDG